MSITIKQLSKEFKDAVVKMGGKIKYTYADGDIDVIFSARSKVSMVTMENDCVGFTSPNNVGFVTSADDFLSIEIF